MPLSQLVPAGEMPSKARNIKRRLRLARAGVPGPG
jgi:hypothetical protein